MPAWAARHSVIGIEWCCRCCFLQLSGSAGLLVGSSLLTLRKAIIKRC